MVSFSHPTFEEYQKRGNYADGLKRCNDALKKKPNHIQLLTVQLRFLAALKHDLNPSLDRLIALTPPIQDSQVLLTIEEAVVEGQRDVYPRPRTAGPKMATLHANALKAARTPDQKLDLQSLRFTTAIYDDRLEDAQQALIQLKALQPRNRVLYMAHAALTQLLSSSPLDLQARLAGSLARKAVAERFDDETTLDCRVPGQILALQGAVEEVQGLRAKFAESKQVFELRRSKAPQSGGNGDTTLEVQPDDLTKLPPKEKFVVKVTSLKRKLASLVQTAAEIGLILSFAVEAIQVFHSASRTLGKGKEGRTTVDAGFLAISALIRAFELSNDPGHLLRAAFVAETLLKHDTHIHEARLILVYLYMQLGLGSRAIDLFDSLNVKEIQHDTVGHAIFTELSYTHPHHATVRRREIFDTSKRASQISAVYTRCEDKLAETEAGVLNHGQSGMIFDLHELRNKLRSSLSRRMMLLEQRRLTRLMQGKGGDEPAKLGPRVLPTWLSFSDNRDFDATFNFGYNVETVLHDHQGQLAAKQWLVYSLILDSAWCLARGTPAAVNDLANLLDEFSNTSTDMSNLEIHPSAKTSPQLPISYRLAADLACQVLRLQLQVQQPDAKADDPLAAVSHALDKLAVDALIPALEPLADNLKAVYAYLDVLRVTARACQALEAPRKELAKELQMVQERVRREFAALQGEAKSRARRSQPAVAGEVRMRLEGDQAVGEALELFGKEWIAEFCDTVAGSVRGGWEGVGLIALN